MENLGRPIVLLAALWGAVNTTLNFFGIINERRDLIFSLVDKCGTCSNEAISLRPAELYFTNLMPLTIGLMIFLALICYVVISIPDYMKIETDEKAQMRRICRAIAALPVFGLFAFAGGGIFDLVMLRPYLFP